MDPLLALGGLFLLTRMSGGGGGGAAERVKKNGTEYLVSRSGTNVTVSRAAPDGGVVAILTFHDQGGGLRILATRHTPKNIRNDVFELAMRDFEVSEVKV